MPWPRCVRGAGAAGVGTLSLPRSVSMCVEEAIEIFLEEQCPSGVAEISGREGHSRCGEGTSLVSLGKAGGVSSSVLQGQRESSAQRLGCVAVGAGLMEDCSSWPIVSKSA